MVDLLCPIHGRAAQTPCHFERSENSLAPNAVAGEAPRGSFVGMTHYRTALRGGVNDLAERTSIPEQTSRRSNDWFGHDTVIVWYRRGCAAGGRWMTSVADPADLGKLELFR